MLPERLKEEIELAHDLTHSDRSVGLAEEVRATKKRKLEGQNSKFLRLFYNLPQGLLLLQEVEKQDEERAQRKTLNVDVAVALEKIANARKDGGSIGANRAIAIMPEIRKKYASIETAGGAHFFRENEANLRTILEGLDEGSKVVGEKISIELDESFAKCFSDIMQKAQAGDLDNAQLDALKAIFQSIRQVGKECNYQLIVDKESGVRWERHLSDRNALLDCMLPLATFASRPHRIEKVAPPSNDDLDRSFSLLQNISDADKFCSTYIYITADVPEDGNCNVGPLWTTFRALAMTGIEEFADEEVQKLNGCPSVQLLAKAAKQMLQGATGADELLDKLKAHDELLSPTDGELIQYDKKIMAVKDCIAKCRNLDGVKLVPDCGDDKSYFIPASTWGHLKNCAVVVRSVLTLDRLDLKRPSTFRNALATAMGDLKILSDFELVAGTENLQGLQQNLKLANQIIQVVRQNIVAAGAAVFKPTLEKCKEAMHALNIEGEEHADKTAADLHKVAKGEAGKAIFASMQDTPTRVRS